MREDLDSRPRALARTQYIPNCCAKESLSPEREMEGSVLLSASRIFLMMPQLQDRRRALLRKTS